MTLALCEAQVMSTFVEETVTEAKLIVLLCYERKVCSGAFLSLHGCIKFRGKKGHII